GAKSTCPLYPRERHQMRHNGMSVKGQKRTFHLDEPILILIKGSEIRHDSHSHCRKPIGGVNAQSLSCDKALSSNYGGSSPDGWFCLAVLRGHGHGTPENH